MIAKLLAGVLSACLIAETSAAFAAAEPRVRHAKPLRHARAALPPAVPIARPGEPARMIQVKPGLFISSYDCVTDEGYGRWRPCSAGSRDGP